MQKRLNLTLRDPALFLFAAQELLAESGIDICIGSGSPECIDLRARKVNTNPRFARVQVSPGDSAIARIGRRSSVRSATRSR